MLAEEIIDKTIAVEGGYSNNPSDSGGETMWGITIATARRSGYTGPMRDMPRSTAIGIYKREFFGNVGIGKVLPLSANIARELFDTGVNMGPKEGVIFMQVALNALNQQGKQYQDVVVDGIIGSKTISPLQVYLNKRGKNGEIVILKIMNCLQGARYIELSQKREKDEDFITGWFTNRVELPADRL